MDDRTDTKIRSAVKYSAAVACLVAIYFAAGWMGFSLASKQPNVSALWPAAGIAVIALATFGRRLWPGVWIGAFLVNLSQSGDPDSSLGIACGNTASNLVGAWFLVRHGSLRTFDKPESLVGFMLGIGLLASGIAATVGTASLAWMGHIVAGPAYVVWLTWWLGDAVSVWLLVPALLLGKEALASLRARRPAVSPARALEFLGAIVILVISSFITFGGILHGDFAQVPTGFANLPALFWLALRFRPLGATVGLLLHCVISVWGTSRGYGSYAGIPEDYLLLQMYLGIRVFSFQFLAVLFSVLKDAIADLRFTEARIRGIIDSIPGVVWETSGNPGDPGYRLTYVSHQISNLFGYSPIEWLTNPGLLWGAIHPEDQARVKEQAAADFARKGNSISQFRIVNKDGKAVDVELRMTALKDAQGRPIGLRGFTMDISERKKAEALLLEAEKRLRQAHKMEAVGRVAGGLAHDFNNLLTTINGYNELILEASADDGDIAGFARQIRHAGSRAANLTHQLLTFSRQDIVQPQVFDLNGLVADRERWLVSLLCEGVHLGITLEPGPLEVKADPSQMERVLTNLVLNARDAMPRGGVITVATSRYKETGSRDGFSLVPGPGPHVMLSVTDTGIGIPPEMMDKLFEPFFTTKTESRSMGLGLPTVYGILERSGGGIRVVSRVGGGTRFEVYLRAMVLEPVPAGAGVRESGPGGSSC